MMLYQLQWLFSVKWDYKMIVNRQLERTGEVVVQKYPTIFLQGLSKAIKILNSQDSHLEHKSDALLLLTCPVMQ
jgi:hypothetical protein